jgi:hypothetical protein
VKNKGQIAIFVLLGFVLLIAASFFLFIRSDNVYEIERYQELPIDFIPVKNYIDSCIKNVGRDAIEYVSKRGGYFELPQYSYNDQFTQTAYYYYEYFELPPKLEVIQNSISEYIENELSYCLDGIKNLSQFSNVEYYIENINTLIVKNSVIIESIIPTEIKKDDSSYNIKDYRITIDNRLFDIYNYNEYIINKQLDDKYSICLSCIINRATTDDLFVDIENKGNGTHIFTILANDSSIGKLTKFIFANKYKEVSCQNIPFDWPEERINDFLSECLESQIGEYNYKLEIQIIPDLIAIAGFPFVYKVNSVGLDVNYTDNTNLFDINQTTGLIQFIPEEEDIGTHYVWINVVDSLENEVFDIFKLNISGKAK